MEKTSKCVKRVVYVCPTPDNCGYFEQYKDKPFCCKYRTDGNAICTCKEAIEEAKGVSGSDIIWHDFPHEKPNFGDLILWSHYQAPSDPPEVIVFDRDTEWLDGDMWAKIK